MARHWSERLSCSCGASFRSYAAEAKHRHNFPLLCRGREKELQAKAAEWLLKGLGDASKE